MTIEATERSLRSMIESYVDPQELPLALSMVDRLVSQHNALVAALKAVEWVYDEPSGASFCEICNRSREDGHNKRCIITAALAAAN